MTLIKQVATLKKDLAANSKENTSGSNYSNKRPQKLHKAASFKQPRMQVIKESTNEDASPSKISEDNSAEEFDPTA